MTACPTTRVDRTRDPRRLSGLVPFDDAPWLDARMATEHDDIVAIPVKGTGENGADLS